MTRQRRHRSWTTRILLSLTTLILLAGVAAVVVSSVGLLRHDAAETWTGAERQPVPEASRQTVVSADNAERPSITIPLEQSDTVKIPVLGFTAPMKSMAVSTSQELYPPTADDVYWLEGYGSPGNSPDNTVYLIGHTSQNGGAVFDPLVNLVEQSTNLLPGDEIMLTTEKTTVTYQVTDTQRHHRTQLANVDGVWENQPGRLVLITCFFDPNLDIAPDNMVVFAEQISIAEGTPSE